MSGFVVVVVVEKEGGGDEGEVARLGPEEGEEVEGVVAESAATVLIMSLRSLNAA